MSASEQSLAVRDVVLAEIVRIGEQQGKSVPPLTDELPLVETNFDSLCFAILVATLDDRLELDPFGGDGPAAFPVTVGALIGLYEAAARRG